MLREPSHRAPPPDEGGDAGASDDESDEDTDPELEGQGENDSEDDSEGRTSPEPKQPKGLSHRFKGKQKGKARGRSGLSSLATSTLHEEGEFFQSFEAIEVDVFSINPEPVSGPSTERIPSTSSTPARPPKAPLRVETALPTAKRAWALPTPGPRPVLKQGSPEGSWTAFAPMTPSQLTAITPSAGSDGYFSSNPSSEGGSMPSSTRDGETRVSSTPSESRGRSPSILSSLGLGAVISSQPPTQATSPAETPSVAVEPQTTTAVVPEPEPAAEPEPQPAAEPEPQPAAEPEPQPEAEPEAADDAESEADTSGDESEATAEMSSVPQFASPPVEGSTSRPNGMLQRPSLYSRPSRSMVDLPTIEPEQRPLEPTRSRENAPMRIELPRKPSVLGQRGALSPTSEWTMPPPTPAAGFSGFVFTKDKSGQPLQRSRSADDLALPPPRYEPALPGVYIPRPRDEEGKEKLPGYWCAVSVRLSLFLVS